VGWKERVSVVVLVLFAALPVSGTLCAMTCDSAAAAASTHHGSGESCREAARSSAGVQIEGASDHDCSNHGASVRQFTSTAPERVELKPTTIVSALSADHANFHSSPLSVRTIDEANPPGTSRRATIPLVLRV
jgi:hypothetical protein